MVSDDKVRTGAGLAAPLDEGNDEVEIDSAAASIQRPKTVSLLDKIRQTLAATPPERWDQAGEELNPTRKYQKPQDTWEELFCTDTRNGVLVLRRSIPIKANFFGGGYTFAENGIPQHFVEIRARGWTPRMLIDPFYRASGGLDKSHQILAEGDVARHLFVEIESNLKVYRDGLRRDFNDSVERLISNIHEQIRSTAAEDWKTLEGDPGFEGYQGDINGMTVTVSQTVQDRSATFAMQFSKYGLKWDCRDANISREVFSVVDDSVRHASLEQLGRVLEDML